MAEGISNKVSEVEIRVGDDSYFHFACNESKKKSKQQRVQLRRGGNATVWSKSGNDNSFTLCFNFYGDEYFISSPRQAQKLWCVLKKTDEEKNEDGLKWVAEQVDGKVRFKSASRRGWYIVRDPTMKAYTLAKSTKATCFTELIVHNSAETCTEVKSPSKVLIRDGETEFFFCPIDGFLEKMRVMLKVGRGSTLLQKRMVNTDREPVEFTLSHEKDGHDFFISPLAISCRLWFVRKERIDEITSIREYKKDSHWFRWVESTQPSKSEVKQEDGASAKKKGLKHVASGHFVVRDDQGYFKIPNPVTFTEKCVPNGKKDTEIKTVEIQMGNLYLGFPDYPEKSPGLIAVKKKARTTWKKRPTKDYKNTFTLSYEKNSKEYFISPAKTSSKLICLARKEPDEVKKERGYEKERLWFKWDDNEENPRRLVHVASGSFVSYFTNRFEVHDPLFFTEMRKDV